MVARAGTASRMNNDQRVLSNVQSVGERVRALRSSEVVDLKGAR